MKFSEVANENYAATIVSVKAINSLENCDNVVGVPFFGFQAIVNKTTEVGDLGVLFTAETQLSEKYMYENNLFRHGNLNKDESAKGYIEDNRRVKAIRFRGHQSSALFMPLSSLEWTGIKVSDLKEGDMFDELNGKPICNKFVRKQRKAGAGNKVSVEEKYIRVDKKFMPEHIDSINYFRNKQQIKGNENIVVTQKLHGTSVRIGNTLVNRKLNVIEKALKKLGVKVVENEYDDVYGSRKVIKDINNPNQNHYYSTDLWTETGLKLRGSIPKGYILYGEIIGYASADAPIQKNYTYNLPTGNSALYIYRISSVNPDGIQIDLSWDQIKEFCKINGLNHVPELWSGRHKSFNVDKFIDTNYFAGGFKNAVPLSTDSPCDEGVCIRREGITPLILKAKSPLFFEHETKMLDEEAVDMEEEGKVE